jgi:ankyrin repeat protein
MVEYLLKKGINISHEDKRSQTPIQFAKKHNKNQIVDLLLQHGAVINDGKKKAGPPKQAPKPQAEVKEKVNERKIPKRYLLTALREGGYYEPLTDEEFE